MIALDGCDPLAKLLIVFVDLGFKPGERFDPGGYRTEEIGRNLLEAHLFLKDAGPIETGVPDQEAFLAA